MFWADDEFGFLAVHCADERSHCPPECGWAFVMSVVDPQDDAEVFYYRRVCDSVELSSLEGRRCP